MIKWEPHKGQKMDYYESYVFKDHHGDMRLSMKRVSEPVPHDTSNITHYAILKRHIDDPTLQMQLSPSLESYFVEMKDGSHQKILQAMELEYAQTRLT